MFHLTALVFRDSCANPSVENLSVRKAAAAHSIKRSTLSDEVLRKKIPSRKSSFAEAEEKLVLQMLPKYADRDVPLDPRHVRKALCFLGARLEPERRERLPFSEK